MTKRESIHMSAVASFDRITFRGVYHFILRHLWYMTLNGYLAKNTKAQVSLVRLMSNHRLIVK